MLCISGRGRMPFTLVDGFRMKTRTVFSAWMLAAAVALSLGFVAAVNGDELSECRRLAPAYGCPNPDDDLEHRLWDGSRVDLFPSEAPWNEYAIEVDWAGKSGKNFEAIGQALYYAEVTGRKPAIILLVKDLDREMRYVHRCQVVCARVGIRLWVEKSEDE